MNRLIVYFSKSSYRQHIHDKTYRVQYWNLMGSREPIQAVNVTLVENIIYQDISLLINVHEEFI